MLINRKISHKLSAGFGLILLLTIATAWFGWSGLTGITERVEKGNDVNGLVKYIYHARLAEKNVISRRDEVYISQVRQYVADLTAQAVETKEKFQDELNKTQMDEVIKAVSQYKTAFLEYVELAKKRDEYMAHMAQEARLVLHEAEDIRADQKEQLANIRTQGDAFINDKITKADDANRLLKLALNAKVLRVALVAQEEADKLAEWDQLNKELLALTDDLKAKFQLQKNVEQANAILASYGKYQQLFRQYLAHRREKKNQQQKELDVVMMAAQDAMAEMQAIRADQKAQLAARLKENDANINDKLSKADDADRIVKLFLEARKNEKEFIISGEQKYVELVDKAIKKAIELAKNLKAGSKQEENVQQTRTVLDSLTEYYQAFKRYVSIAPENRQQRDDTMKEMRQVAAVALEQAEDIRVVQRNQLGDIRRKAPAFINDKMTKANDANRMLKLALDAKALRVALVAQEEADKLAKWNQLNKALIELVNDLKARFQLQKNVNQADAILVSYGKYQQLFLQYLAHQHEAKNQQQKELGIMIAAAQEAMNQMQAIRTDQEAQLAARREENNVRINDKLTKADAANRIIKWYLDARKNEKQFVISQESKYVDIVTQSVEKTLKFAKELTATFKFDKNVKQGKEVIQALESYSKAFQQYVSLVGQQKVKEQKMIEAARHAQDVNQAARVDQEKKMESEINLTEQLIFTISVIAIVFVVMIALLVTRSIVRPLTKAVEFANQLAVGNLASNITVTGQDEMGKLLQAFANMQSQFRSIIASIQQTAVIVNTSAEEIAQSNVSLSQRTEQQAASLEETAASMEEMTGTVLQTADNAKMANQLASSAKEQATTGGEVVGAAINAMTDINTSSKKVTEIISVINEIAFQTNLLALNAAVEAARAGEQGRGFAVVASEVRNLAQRSATAAKEIKGLIQDSVIKVEEGTKLVNESGNTLGKIVTSVKKVSDIVAEIAAASAEQSSSINQANKAVTQMDEMVQQNAAAVEETAAASESLKERATNLKEQVAFFNIGELALPPRIEKKPTNKKLIVKHTNKPKTAAPPAHSASKTAHDNDGWEDF